MPYPAPKKIGFAAWMLVCLQAAAPFAVSADTLSDDLAKEKVALGNEYDNRLRAIGARLLSQVGPAAMDDGAINLPFTVADRVAETAGTNKTQAVDGVVVAQILDPAAAADIRAGDVVVRFDGMTMRDAQNFRKIASQTPVMNSVLVRLKRDGKEWDQRILLTSERVVPFAVAMESGEISSEMKDGVVQMSSVLIHFADDDDQLAFVMAHEIAHAVLKHKRTVVSDTRANAQSAAASAIVEGIFSAVLSTPVAPTPVDFSYMTGPYPMKSETDADVYALKLMKKAGYDPAAAYEFLTQYESEVAKSKSAYSNTLGQIHPLSVDRIALAKKSIEGGPLDEPATKNPVERAPVRINEYDEPTSDLGAVADAAIDQSEFKLRESFVAGIKNDQQTGRGPIYFYDSVDKLIWFGVIDESYQLFEVGSVKVELYSPSGEIVRKCENTYVATSPCSASCEISLKEIYPAKRVSGVWTVKVHRSQDLIDVRNIYLTDRIRSKKFLIKRSQNQQIASGHSAEINLPN